MKDSVNREQRFNIQLCEEHRIANSYGLPLNVGVRCKCCNKIIDKRSLRMAFSIEDLYYSGSGLPSYLITIKYLILLSLGMLLIYSSGLMVLNYTANGCQSLPNCSNSLILKLSIINTFNSSANLLIESYILIAGYLVIFFISQLLRKQLRKINQDINESNLNPEQFALLIKSNQYNFKQNDIKFQIEKWWKKQLNVLKQKLIILFPELYEEELANCFETGNNISQITHKGLRLNDSNSKILQNIITSYNYPQFLSFKDEIQIFKKQLQQKGKIQSKQYQIIKNTKKKILEKLSINSFCIVIFKKKEYARYFLNRNKPTFVEQLFCYQDYRLLEIENKQILVEAHNYPAEILWQNHHFSAQSKIKIYLLSIVGILMVLLSGLGVILALIAVLNAYVLKSGQTIESNFSLLMGLILTFFTYLSNFLINIISSNIKSATKPEYQYLIVSRIIFVNCCTLCLAPLIFYLFVFNQVFWYKNGFIQLITYFMAFYLTISHVGKYLSFSTIKSLIIYKMMKKEDQFKQEQANEHYQKPHHRLQQEYAWLVSSLYLSFFFAPFIPFIFIFLLLSFLVQLLLQRINIAYFYKQKQYFGNIFNYKMVQLIQRCGFFFILGSTAVNLLAWKTASFQLNTINLTINGILLVFQLLGFILPNEKINEALTFFNKAQQKQNQIQLLQKFYSNAKDNFLTFFQQQNPVLAYLQKQNIKVSKQSDQIKIIQQMQTMSKTLFLSIKERLMNNQPSVLNHANKMTTMTHGQESQIGDIYFEYEKKIIMEKPVLKIIVPPLFKKEKNNYGNQQTKNNNKNIQLDMVNFFSAFSDDDEEGKKIVKKFIKAKVKNNNLNK